MATECVRGRSRTAHSVSGFGANLEVDLKSLDLGSSETLGSSSAHLILIKNFHTEFTLCELQICFIS